MVTTTRSRVSEGIDGKDAVGLYLEGIAKTPLLTAEEEVELAKTIEIGLYAEHILSGEVTLAERGKRAKRPTKAELEFLVDEGRRAMQHFVTANLRLVVSVARKYGRSQMPLLDLVQEGNTGLIRAVEKFDYTKGFKFSTYGTWWVRQSISRGIAQQGRIVRLPVHVAEQVNQVGAVRRTLERRLGRDPEIEEIAAEMDLEPERVLDLMRYGRDHVSLDAPVEEGGDTALGDLIAREPMPGSGRGLSRRRGACSAGGHARFSRRAFRRCRTPSVRTHRRSSGKACRHRRALGNHRRARPPDRAACHCQAAR